MRDDEEVTLSSREIQGAVRILLTGDIAKHTVSEGTKAVLKVNPYIEGMIEGEAVGSYFRRECTVMYRTCNAGSGTVDSSFTFLHLWVLPREYVS